jgi:hypothetical protein
MRASTNVVVALLLALNRRRASLLTGIRGTYDSASAFST